MDFAEEEFGALGAPTDVEMWKHQVVLVTNEAEYLNQELVKARQNIAKLVSMNEALTRDLQTLQVKTVGRVLPVSCGLNDELPQEPPARSAGTHSPLA